MRHTTSSISRKLLPALFNVLMTLHTNAQDTARWADKTIIVDGQPSEWQQKDFIKDEKSGYSYCISNDTSALYIGLLLKDEILKTKSLNAGFSIFLNSDAKQKKSYVIDFPLPDAEYDLSADPRLLMDLKSIQLMGLLHAKQYELSGFKDGSGRYNTGEGNNAGVGVSIAATDSGFLFYEAKIPFTAIFKKINYFNEINQKNIAVCFSFNAVSRPPATSAQLANNTPPPTVSNSRGRGITSPSNNPYGISTQSPKNFGQMEKLFQNSKTWKIVNLAKPS